MARDAAAVQALGAALFMEPALSGAGTQACGTCHQPARAFTDGRTTAQGSTGAQHWLNTPSLVHVGAGGTVGWASPGMTVEHAIARALSGVRPVELGAGGREAEILGRLAMQDRYRRAFRAAFPHDAQPMTWLRVIDALAAYVRGLRREGPYDRFLAGDRMALSPLARQGAALFVELGCHGCHSGPSLTNGSYHNLGLYPFVDPAATPASQQGLYAVTRQGADLGRWRVPSLRNVARTAPYFHDGSAPTLDAVFDVYTQGGRGNGRANPLKSPAIQPVPLRDADRAALRAFLEELDDP